MGDGVESVEDEHSEGEKSGGRRRWRRNRERKKRLRVTLPNKLKISSFSSLTSSFLLQLKEILMDPKRKWFPLYLFYTLIYPDFGDDLSFQRNQVSAEGPEIFPKHRKRLPNKLTSFLPIGNHGNLPHFM